MSVYKSASKAKKISQKSSGIAVPESMKQEVNGSTSSRDLPQTNDIKSASPEETIDLQQANSKQSLEHKSATRTNTANEAQQPLQSLDEMNIDDDFDEDTYGEGLRLLKCGHDVELTRRDANKIMRIVTKAHDKVDTVSRKSIDLPNYIDTEVESLLNNFKRKTNVKISVKSYIISLICKDLISRGVFSDVKTGR